MRSRGLSENHPERASVGVTGGHAGVDGAQLVEQGRVDGAGVGGVLCPLDDLAVFRREQMPGRFPLPLPHYRRPGFPRPHPSHR